MTATGSTSMSEDQHSHRAPLQLGLGMALFGSATPLSKIVGGAFPVFAAGALRMGLGVLTLLPFLWARREEMRRLKPGDWGLIGLIAVFGMFGFSALMLYGMRLAPGVLGATVMSATPALTAVGAIVFLKERPDWRVLGAVALAIAGIVLLQAGGQGGDGNDGGRIWLGAGLVLAACACEAAYTLLGRVAAKRDIDPVITAGLAAALALPPFIVVALMLGEWGRIAWGEISGGEWASLAAYGAGTLGLGSWLWYAGVARSSGVMAAGFMGVMPVSALVMSYVLLDEAFRWRHLLGFGVVFAGVLLIAWRHASMARDMDG